MITVLSYFAAALPVAIIVYFNQKKIFKQDYWLLGVLVGLGMLATLPSFQVEGLENLFDAESRNSGWPLFAIAFGLVGFGEEFFKLLLGVLIAHFMGNVKSLRSGIATALSIAMGFALLENILYAYLYPLSTVAVRSFTAVPAHAIFGIISGYFLGMAYTFPKVKWGLIGRGLLIASFLHGAYDWMILQEYNDWLTGVALLILSLGIYYCYYLLQRALKSSPYSEYKVEAKKVAEVVSEKKVEKAINPPTTTSPSDNSPQGGTDLPDDPQVDSSAP